MTNLPVSGDFTVTAGYREVNKNLWSTYHKGIDFVSGNLDVYSVCTGVVRVVNYDSGGWGWYVSIGDTEFTHCHHVFCHLNHDTINVRVGDKVTPTTLIGKMGCSGNVTGVHLHYQLMLDEQDVNPNEYFNYDFKRGHYNSKDFEVNTMYNDEQQISGFAKEAVKNCYKSGVMKGYEDNSFKPKTLVTREELATTIDRLITLMKG